MAHEDIAAGSSGAHHQVDDRQRPEDVVVEPEERDGRIFFVKHGQNDDEQSVADKQPDFERILRCKNSSLAERWY